MQSTLLPDCERQNSEILVLSERENFEECIRQILGEGGRSWYWVRSYEDALAYRDHPIRLLIVHYPGISDPTAQIFIRLRDEQVFPGAATILFGKDNIDKQIALSLDAVDFFRLPEEMDEVAPEYSSYLLQEIERIISDPALAVRKSRRNVFRAIDEDLAYFKHMVESTGVAMLSTDPEGIIQTVNLAGLVLFGYISSEVADRTYKMLLSPENKGSLLAEMEEGALDRDGWHGELTFRRKDGSDLIAWTSVRRLWDERGRCLGMVIAMHDVSYIKELERRNQDMKAQLARAQRLQSIGTLVSGIAHDFNNLLVGVLGHASRVRGKMAPSDPLYESISYVEQSAERAAELARSLLTYSRATPGNPTVMDLNSAVKETIKIIRPTLPSTIEIATRLDMDLYPIEADGGQVVQVIMNLVINARDAMPHGGRLTLETRRLKVGQSRQNGRLTLTPGHYTSLIISDTGCGISAENQDKIFDAFFTTKPPGEGTGLGLSMVRQIVEAYGGVIEVNSRLGKGTHIEIVWPGSEKAHREEPKPESEKIPGGNEAILVVDDESFILRLAAEVLSSSGYRVFTASDGLEALALFREKNKEIDLVLLDLTMPKMSGTDCMARIREINGKIPVIISSGYSLDSSEKRAILSQASGILPKPYRTAALLVAVRKVLDEGSLLPV